MWLLYLDCVASFRINFFRDTTIFIVVQQAVYIMVVFFFLFYYRKLIFFRFVCNASVKICNFVQVCIYCKCEYGTMSDFVLLSITLLTLALPQLPSKL